MKTFLVTTSHRHPDYNFVREPVRVRQDAYTGGFYADGKLGMSKCYPTEHSAAIAMFLDNACTIIRVEEA